MALTRAKKAEKVEQLAKELEGSTSAIVGTFAKLTVAQDFELRKTVRNAGGRYRVLKNKLAARASKGSQIEAALQGLKGVSSVAYTKGDPVALAKALSTWVEENAQTVISSVVRAKPSAAKGKYIKSVTLSSTMGPGVPLDSAVADAAGKH